MNFRKRPLNEVDFMKRYSLIRSIGKNQKEMEFQEFFEIEFSFNKRTELLCSLEFDENLFYNWKLFNAENKDNSSVDGIKLPYSGQVALFS